MKHSSALVTGTTSGLGYAAPGFMLATAGYRQVIVTGAQVGPDPANGCSLFAVETKKKIFTPPGAGSGPRRPAVQSALGPGAWSSAVSRSISCCSMQGWSHLRSARLTAGGVEASQAPLIGHHQLTVGLLRGPTC